MFNYYFDEDREGHQDVVKLFDAIKAGQYEGYASSYVTDELMKAPEPKRTEMMNLIEHYGIIILDYSLEAARLADIYQNAGIIPQSQRPDSLHVAAATVYRLDYIISYNFQHINRDKVRLRTAIVNYNEGYKGVSISTAKEILNYGQ